jgi:hypothetical protein
VHLTRARAAATQSCYTFERVRAGERRAVSGFSSMGSDEKKTDRNHVGSPAREGLKSAAATALSAVPVAGGLISGALWGLMQAETTAKINASFERLDESIRSASRSVEEIHDDPVFRLGVARLVESIAKQESAQKQERIHNFLEQRLKERDTEKLVAEGVLRAFDLLPASHIEAFLDLIGATAEELLGFSLRVQRMDFNLQHLLAKEFSQPRDPARAARSDQLHVLFLSLQTAGLVTRRDAREIFQTTRLAKAFVYSCLPANQRVERTSARPTVTQS